MKHICIGVMAHVDAGKTTLLEAMLFKGGATRRLGRVDHQNAFLDTDEQERARGITIFSKQAELALPEASITFLDTPGQDVYKRQPYIWRRPPYTQLLRREFRGCPFRQRSWIRR